MGNIGKMGKWSNGLKEDKDEKEVEEHEKLVSSGRIFHSI